MRQHTPIGNEYLTFAGELADAARQVLADNIQGGLDTSVKADIDASLSKEAQVELLKVGLRRPSRSDIKVSDYVKLPELDAIKIIPIDEVEASQVRKQFLANWDALPKAGGRK